MDTITMLPLALRGAERIAIVAVAALCIVLGYKLFKIVPDRHEGEGALSLGDLSISLSKIGPGVFFAIFGAVILYQALQSVIDMNVISAPSPSSNEPNQVVAEERTQIDINWMNAQDEDKAIWAERASGPIKILNCLQSSVSANDVKTERIKNAVHIAKVAIIADVWQDEWGDSETFLELNMGNIPSDSRLGEIYNALGEDC